jgi:hypothetical protein
VSGYTGCCVRAILLSGCRLLSYDAIAVSCHGEVSKWLGHRKNHDEFMNPIVRVSLSGIICHGLMSMEVSFGNCKKVKVSLENMSLYFFYSAKI